MTQSWLWGSPIVVKKKDYIGSLETEIYFLRSETKEKKRKKRISNDINSGSIYESYLDTKTRNQPGTIASAEKIFTIFFNGIN